MTLHGNLGCFASYISEHGTLKDAKLYVRSKNGTERFCTIIAGDDPRTVFVGAKLRIHYDGFDDQHDEVLKQDSNRILCLIGSQEHNQQLKKQFTQLDANHDGKLSFAELKHLFKILSPKSWKEDDLRRVYDAVDQDENGSIELDEFIHWVNSGRHIPKRPKKPPPEEEIVDAVPEDDEASGEGQQTAPVAVSEEPSGEVGQGQGGQTAMVEME